ncbi:hypothetical protein T484DRAFT_1983105 [Baffinella frigidus]|nr:hypothetical protein T484DRAFT_1983105 [Cryptophyta sp. CCMP2293]|mmetsp:Transcript_26848/g.62235  ORF Transcript_26848/g.62235 Transcript_26848/m.62235 type:complete len:253 (+) Transcript_26848:61-819(+)
MPRLSVIAAGLAGLTLLHAAEAFAPSGGAWLQTPSKRASLRPSIDSAPSRHGGAIAGPTMLLDGVCSPSKRRSNNHKNPPLSFRPRFSTGVHLIKEDEVRKEVLENTAESFVDKFDHSLYTSLSHSSQAVAQHLPSVNKLFPFAKSLPPGLDLPAILHTIPHTLLQAAGHTPYVTALPLVGAAIFYAAFRVEAEADAASLARAGRNRMPERHPRWLVKPQDRRSSKRIDHAHHGLYAVSGVGTSGESRMEEM